MRNRTGKPVRREDFFDRPAVLAELWHLVERDSVVLLAPRRVGKTSLLLRMVDAPRDGWRALYVTVESVDDEARFVARLARNLYRLAPGAPWWARLGHRVRDVLAHLERVDAGPVELHLTRAIGEDWRQVGDTLLGLMGQLPGETRTLIGLDEFPIFVRRLLDSPDGLRRARMVLDWFREARQDPRVDDAGVAFLVAGSIGLDAVTRRVRLSGTINDLESFHLGPLGPDEADDLLAALAAGEGLALTPELRAHMHRRVTWPIPYHLQLMVNAVLRLVRFHGGALTPATIDAAYDRLLGSSSRKHFAHWAERLDDPLVPPPERALTAAVLEAAALDPRGVAFETVRQLRARHAPEADEDVTLAALAADGYLLQVPRTDEDPHPRWRFASTLLRDWWRTWRVREA